jgi:Mn2+/Fe2+ NRAMP family transporter
MKPLEPPSDWRGIVRQLGPGVIISATIVGSGELIVTPKLGASVGMTLLWFIIGGCVLKVFIQLALGRYAVSSGKTTLESLDLVPGPRLRVSWVLWPFFLMFVAMIVQVAGMMGGLASIAQLMGVPVSKKVVAIVFAAVTAVLLVSGRYKMVERVSLVFVVVFTLCTVAAMFALQSTPYAVTWAEIGEGLSFNLPPSTTVAFAAFGIIGVGAAELIYYPYWCLEKGYGKFVGPQDGTPGWTARARGWLKVMQVDAWVACAIYTVATVAFYLLGAAVLHEDGMLVENADMIVTLSAMYQRTFGEWSLWLFLCGAFAVLYSTVFVATAANARLLVDSLSVLRVKRYADETERARWLKYACVAIPVAFTCVYLVWESPVTLVLIGALSQGLMLPFLAIAAIYLHHRKTERSILPGRATVTALWLAGLAMIAVGAYQFVTEILKRI